MEGLAGGGQVFGRGLLGLPEGPLRPGRLPLTSFGASVQLGLPLVVLPSPVRGRLIGFGDGLALALGRPAGALLGLLGTLLR